MTSIQKKQHNPQLIRDQTLSVSAPIAFCIRKLLMEIRWKGDITELSDLITKDPSQLDIVDTRNILLSLGYSSKLERTTDISTVRKSFFPLIFLSSDNSPYVLFADQNDNIYAANPYGKFNLDEINCEGQFLVLEEAEKTRNSPLLKQIFYKFSRKISLLYFTSFLISLLALALPIYLRVVFNVIVPSQNYISAILLLFGTGLLFLLDHNIRRWRSTILKQMFGRLDTLIGVNIIKKFFDLDLAKIEAIGTFGYINKIRSLENVISFGESQLAPAILDFPFVVVYLLAIWIIAGNLALIPVILMSLLAVIILFLSRYYAGIQELNLSTGISIFQAQQEIVRRFLEIRLSRLEWVWFQNMRALSANSTTTSLSINQQISRLQILISASSQMAGVLTLSIGAWLSVTQTRDLSSGDLIASMFIVWRIFGSFQSLMSALLRSYITVKQYNQIQSFLLLPESSKKDQIESISSLIYGSIKLESVTYRPPGADYIIKKASFEFPMGSINALTGSEGGGKTTLLKIIAQLYPITSGKLTFDGIDYRQFGRVTIQKSISYVETEPKFLPGSLMYNLTISNPDIKPDKVISLCEELCILPFIDSLPDKFDTVIDQNSASVFPLGIRKMISLAQGLIKPASVLLVDDIGLGLTYEQFEKLTYLIPRFNYSDQTQKTRTVIICSNNNQILKAVDSICIIDKGISVFQGSEHDLRKNIT